MKRIYSAIVCLVISLVLGEVSAQISDAMRKLNTAVFAVRELYVDTVNETKMVEDMINHMLHELDPHSSYTTAEETKELNEPLEGNFSGIGIQFNIDNDTLLVVQIISGGPSERVGMQAGDRIIAVNDSVIAGIGLKTADVRKFLRGPEGTKVDVRVLRRGVAKPIDFRITREQIPIYSVDASYMVDDKTGYIRVSRFAATTHDEMVEAMQKLKKQGMKQLILDLQDNGGGYLMSAVYMANEFLERGQLIVYTEGDKSPRSDAIAEAQGSFVKNKLVVLVDEGSASSSEIVSGALQDWDRAVLVGRRTFGKGLVQRPIPFADGSMIRLTVSRYHTPAGRCIQKPYDKGQKEYYKDIYDRYKHGELMHADSIQFADSLQYKTLVTGRTIYGGGGIMPDVFVPLDTTLYTDYHRDIVAKGTLSQFAMKYIDKHRKKLEKQYKDIESYIAGFEIDDKMLTQLKEAGDADKVEYDAEEAAKSRDMIARQLKALIARDLFDMSAYFQVMNPIDPVYLKGVEIINNDEEYNRLLGR
ncbi:MAG: S41 family peptidase [Bacteroidaceae bacterium]|nr:S41 family peptidase [Bacteroidaceae bacterium]